MTKARKLRALMETIDVVRIAGAHNGLTAKLVEKCGFEGVWASSLEMSASNAVPDAGVLTMTDYLNLSIQMNDAVSIPVIVDVDTGYGNSINVMHMVEKFEAAGIAAVAMEDKVFPKQNSLLENGRQDLASIPEFVGKIMAAKSAQKGKDFMVFARVEALIAGWGVGEALKRASAYAQAGADGIFIHSKQQDPAEILAFVEAWDKDIPLILCPTNYNSLTLADIKKLKKVKIMIFANHGLRAAVKAIKKTLTTLVETGDLRTVSEDIVPMTEIFELQGTTRMKEREKKYVRSGNADITTVILAAGIPQDIYLENLLRHEIPLVMLDINGKTILERNLATLEKTGIKDINVVTGFQAEKITYEKVNKFYNPDFGSKRILHSIFQTEKILNGRTLLCYGDIIFDQILLERLLKTPGDITLVVDASYKTSNIRNRKLDLLVTTDEPIIGIRKIDQRTRNPILKIGRKVCDDESTFEFIGIAFFSEKGIQAFKDTYKKAKIKYQNSDFNGAANIDQADFCDLIQEMIDDGHTVDILEVNSGWSEVHNFEDYKRISKILTP